MTISTYQYSIQSQQPEREISFVRPGAPSTLKAEVYALDPQGARASLISTVPAADITVEMNSTSQKIAGFLMPGRLLQDKSISDLNIPQQNALLNSLAPLGTRKIEVVGGIINGRAVEVETLSIFDPT